MALTVTQRPEEELFVEENPDVYDVPYFTSRWNAANLPLVYKITNTKFPVNTEDAIEDILSVATNGGFAELTLDAATFTFVNKGYVQVTNTTNYNGVWQIREVVDANTIVINAPFIATETGNVQNYYNNYNTLVKVYSGLPEYHPLNSTNPMTLITDNPITITPNSDNEAVIDVASLVKSKINLDNDYELNDLNIFTSLYIEYSEQYDESNGTTVSTTTEAYQEDLIAGCDAGASNFVDNGDFTTNLNDWTNEETGIDWVQDTGSAQVSLGQQNIQSKELTQFVSELNTGVEYTLSFDYVLGSNNVIIEVFVGNAILQDTYSGSGSVNVKFIYENVGNLSIRYKLFNSSTVEDLRLDNVSIVNALTNPCIAYVFTTHSAQQPQYKYGGNMGEYVQNFNGGQFANKWLTLFEKPVLFKDNYFDISTIIPQNVIQSAIQAGGFFLEVVEFDKNGTAIEDNQYPITQNLGDGVYRFRLDDKDFNNLTKEFTVQILRIPVNLFVDGDQGTFNTTADTNGNPPSDWNLEKDARAIINFDNTLSFEGAASLKFESRSIFNDDYGFKMQGNTPFSETASAGKEVAFRNSTLGDLLPNFDFTSDFVLSFDFYLTDYYLNGYQNIFVAREDSSNFIRVVTGATGGFNDDLIIVVEVGGVTNTLTFNSALSLNTLYSFELIFNQGVDFTVNLNSSTQTDNSGAIITTSYLSEVNFGGNNFSGTFRPLRAVIQNFQLTNVSLEYDFKFNQEQGMQVFDTVTQSNFDVLQDYSNSELAFGGGAWIDTTTI